MGDSHVNSGIIGKTSSDIEMTADEMAICTHDSPHAPMTLLDVPRSCFSQILLVPDMLGDHLPDAYVKALQPVVPSHLEEYLTRVEPPRGYT